MSGKNKGGREVRKPKQPKAIKDPPSATQLTKPATPKQGKPETR
jgi:hypothetical protein